MSTAAKSGSILRSARRRKGKLATVFRARNLYEVLIDSYICIRVCMCVYATRESDYKLGRGTVYISFSSRDIIAKRKEKKRKKGSPFNQITRSSTRMREIEKVQREVKTHNVTR